jgi:hypothetical protein
MTDEEKKESEAKVENTEAKDEKDSKSDKEKAYFEDTVKATFDTLTEQLGTVADSQKSIVDTLTSIDDRVKALETPTDLPATPKGTADKEDVGEETKAPEKPYPQGEQAGLDDDGESTSDDDSKLSGQEKPIGKAELVQKSEHTFTTETPRPNAAIETLEKSDGADFSPILKDARAGGYEGLSQVAQGILSGKYYKPTDDEVGRY